MPYMLTDVHVEQIDLVWAGANNRRHVLFKSAEKIRSDDDEEIAPHPKDAGGDNRSLQHLAREINKKLKASNPGPARTQQENDGMSDRTVEHIVKSVNVASALAPEQLRTNVEAAIDAGGAGVRKAEPGLTPVESVCKFLEESERGRGLYALHCLSMDSRYRGMPAKAVLEQHYGNDPTAAVQLLKQLTSPW